MRTSQILFPKPVGDLLSHLPGYPGSVLFCTALNVALAKQLAPDVTQMLQGKRLRLRVIDAQWTFDFGWANARFTALHHTGPADLTLSASAHDFVLLARRQEDPDTLFFNRRLCMEGDTELGLLVKNTMDGLELPVFNLQQFKPVQVLQGMRARFKAPIGPHGASH